MVQLSISYNDAERYNAQPQGYKQTDKQTDRQTGRQSDNSIMQGPIMQRTAVQLYYTIILT